MLLTPIVCAAILARKFHWAELATLIAAFSALALKDPAVVLFRQWFVWKQPNPETKNAAKWVSLWFFLLAVSGLYLLFTWPIHATLALGFGVALFSILAVFVNVKNRQRSHALPDRQRRSSNLNLARNCSLRNRRNPALVLVLVAIACNASRNRNPRRSRATRRTHRRTQESPCEPAISPRRNHCNRCPGFCRYRVSTRRPKFRALLHRSRIAHRRNRLRIPISAARRIPPRSSFRSHKSVSAHSHSHRSTQSCSSSAFGAKTQRC